MKSKNLILIRHAKSSWKFNVSDIDRPLKDRGINDALLVSSSFKKRNYNIDKVYSSPANRAFSTCEIFKKQLQWNEGIIEKDETLYDFSGEAVLQFISNIDNSFDTVVIFGHNHAFTSIANAYGDRYVDNLPTSGLVALSFNVESWKFVKYGKTELLLFPRDFK